MSSRGDRQTRRERAQISLVSERKSAHRQKSYCVSPEVIRIVSLVVYPISLRIVSTMRIGLPMVISALEEKPLVRHAAVPSGPAAIVRGPISTLPSTPKRNLVDARSLVEAIDVNWTGKRSNCHLGASKTPQRQSRSAAKAPQRRRKGAAKAQQGRRKSATRAPQNAAKALPKRSNVHDPTQ